MRIVWSAIIVGFVMAGAIAEGQETRGKILGTVQDASGVVPGANIKITNVDTGTSLQFFNSPWRNRQPSRSRWNSAR